jgi:hypothetical protein
MASDTPRDRDGMVTPDEETPLVSAREATAREFDQAQREADQAVVKAMRSLGGDTWCEYVVDSRQFEDYPAMLLLCARTIRITLGFFIIICVIALIYSYFWEGKINTREEIDQQESIQAPNLVICPQPWGAVFESPVLAKRAELIAVPGGNVVKDVDFSRVDCTDVSDRLVGCSCFDFSSTITRPHGERGNLEYLEYVEFVFSAVAPDPLNKQFAFGFFSATNWHTPQQWSYSQIGYVSEGDIRLEEVAHGRTAYTEGTTEIRYGFRQSGEAPSSDGYTVLVFGYDKYLAYITSNFEDKFEIFAIMTIAITFCAAINNFGLFDIFFPEKLDEENPAQLKPNARCTWFFGCCCIFCTPKAELKQRFTDKGLVYSPSP